MINKVLITGGAGFVGTNLCEFLVDNDYQVKVLDNLESGDKNRLPDAVEFIEGDVTNLEDILKASKDVVVIVHLAALPRVQDSIDNPVKTHEVNVDGTLKVLEVARLNDISKLVLASSSAIYGNNETLPLKEDLLPDPLSPYALHKLTSEEYLSLWNKLYDTETVSLRFFNIYGPHLDPEGPYALVIGRFLKMAQARQLLTITGDGEQTRDFIHVKDVCSAIKKAIDSNQVGKGEVFNIGSGKETSINTLAQYFSNNIEYIEPRIEPRHTVADITKASEILGWQPQISLEEGILELKNDWGLNQ